MCLPKGFIGICFTIFGSGGKELDMFLKHKMSISFDHCKEKYTDCKSTSVWTWNCCHFCENEICKCFSYLSFITWFILLLQTIIKLHV